MSGARDATESVGRPVRVLRVIGGLDPESGGPSNSSVNHTLACQAAGAANTIVYPYTLGLSSRNSYAIASLRAAGVITICFPLNAVLGLRARRWGVSVALARWVLRHIHEFDVVHVHGAWGMSQLSAVLSAAVTGRPAVMTPHESLTAFDIASGSEVPSGVKRALARVYALTLSELVMSSQLEARDSGAFRGVRVWVLPHPVPAETAESAWTAASRDTPPLKVGYLGRFHPKKNVDVLIRATAAASASARLIVAGDGPREYLKYLKHVVCDAGMASRVEWRGWLDVEARQSFLDEISVLALPSAYECFGMAAAEGMARGVPPIVSAATGIAELVHRYDCGYVVRPSVAECARAIREVECARSLVGFRQRCLAAARLELSLEAHGRAMVAAYETMCCRNTSRAQEAS